MGRKFETPELSEIDQDEAKEKEDTMAEVVKRKLQHGYIQDLKKPEIDHFERAAILADVLEENDWSIREMGRKFGISKSTLEDWLLWNNIEKEQYQKLIGSGMTHTQVYRELRDRKKSRKDESSEEKAGTTTADASGISEIPLVDRKLKAWEEEVREWRSNKLAFSSDTEDLLFDFRVALEDFEEYMEEERKGED